MKKTHFKKVTFYYRPGVQNARLWEDRLTTFIQRRFPRTLILPANVIPKAKKESPDILLVLGGDGTIIEATQKFSKWNPLIMGFNLGHVGFLASVREQKEFIPALKKALNRKFRVVPRMAIQASVFRRGKKIFSSHALNDIAVENLLGMVDINVKVAEHPVQHIHGNGVIIATATGSTAYNLSAHGPIVMPDIKCFIITELMDHNIPTPSLIVKRNRTISITIEDFRKKERFLIRTTGEPADVILATDSERIFALKKGDRINITRSERLVRFVELEKNYFFKSLQEKFAFR